MAKPQHGWTDGQEFGWTRLDPASDLLYPPEFEVFQIDVKSDTEIGTRLLVDPLKLFREEIPAMNIADPPNVIAQVHRVNAEHPANPVRRREVWVVYSPPEDQQPSTQTAVGVQYKFMS
jgi:hypothetical protein